MSANIEYALITRVIQDQDFHTLEKMQITEDYFSVPEMREVYRYMREMFHHPMTAGQVPSLDMVRHRFAGFVAGYAPDPVSVLAHELRREKVRVEILMLAQKLQLEAEKDPAAAMATLKAQTQKLASISEVSSDLSMASAFGLLRDRYELVAQAGGVVGIPYPWQAVNEETQGMQPGQFIVIYGRPKSMKTWIALQIGTHAYMSSRRRVLFYTREMSITQVAQRAAASICNVNYKHFINGTLQPEVRDFVFDTLQHLIDDEASAGKYGEHQPYFIITQDKSSGGVSWLQSKIREMKPDLVIVDGMYLMKDDRSNSRNTDWKNIAHISQDIKLTAQEFDIPIIGVTQANRGAEKTKGEDLTELAFADSLGQDADAVFRVTRTTRNDESTGGLTKTELFITAPGLREGKFDGIVINGEPATDFSYIRTIVNTDMQEGYGQQAPAKTPKFVAPRPPGATFSKKPQQFMDPVIKVK